MGEVDDGLKMMRRGSFMYLLAFFILLLAIAFTIVTFKDYKAPEFMKRAFIAALGIFVTFIMEIMLAVMGFIYFFIAAEKLRKVNQDYGIGRKGMILQLFGFCLIFVLMPLAFLLKEFNNPLILLLAITGAVVILIGVIFFGIMLLRMKDLDRGFETAGILYLIGIAIPILIVFAMISIYMSSSRAMKRLSATKA